MYRNGEVMDFKNEEAVRQYLQEGNVVHTLAGEFSNDAEFGWMLFNAGYIGGDGFSENYDSLDATMEAMKHHIIELRVRNNVHAEWHQYHEGAEGTWISKLSKTHRGYDMGYKN